MSQVVLRKHQIDAADAVESAWREGVRRPLVDACVAFGKSLTMGEIARREVARGGRAIILAHTRELVDQNASAAKRLGLQVGINAAALGQRVWRAPVISAAIQSVYKRGNSFGHVTCIGIDESHLVPHSEAGMYHEFLRAFPDARIFGASGTVFRLQGGSLVEGEAAPFDKVAYRYTIVDGIRDGYLVPAFSLGATDKIDPSKLKTRNGDFTPESSDAQMIAQIDNHIMQMVNGASDRRSWLIFEASAKAALAMAQRMTEWGIPTGCVLGKTGDAERARMIADFRTGRLRALTNVNTLCIGFDVPEVDLLVMRRPTKSLGLYIQQIGRGLRCVGGNIDASVAAGKADCAVMDFASNIDQHGPLDFLTVRESRVRLVSCDDCGTRNAAAAAKCWKCGAAMLKNCPACLNAVEKKVLDCPHCGFDMRQDRKESTGPKLSDVPSGAALIASFKNGSDRSGGWQAIRRVWAETDGADVVAVADGVRLKGVLAERVKEARWVRADGSALLLPNGLSRTSARQITPDGAEIIVPLPAVAATEAAA